MDGMHTPTIHPAGGHHGPAPSWDLNYPVLTFLMNGQYYAEYKGTLGMMGLPVMSERQWMKVVSWLGGHVEELANSSCAQVREMVSDRGDKFKWIASFDGFYLTRGHHSNNSSATLHDTVSDKIAWYAHRTKRGSGANWAGTSAGAEGDMLRCILEEVKEKEFKIIQIVMDHDTSACNIVTDVFPEIRITYCGNHTAKTFQRDLVKIKAIQCKCVPKCKARITEQLITRAKKSLRNIMACPDVLTSDDPLKAFSEALLNFHCHYCLDQHSSEWCKYHPKEAEDGTPYSTQKPLKCVEQSDAFLHLLQEMAKRPQEYITPQGRMTTNSIEGFHGLALKYRGKKVDLHHSHYICKTNMAICHKNLGPLWKVLCLWMMEVDVPFPGVAAIFKEHVNWQRLHTRRGTPEYRKYKSSLKTKANQRHEMEKARMDTLKTTGVSTSSYKGDSLLDNGNDESGDENNNGSGDDLDDDGLFVHDDDPVSDGADCNSDPNCLPLLFVFDCETTGLHIYKDHIVELAAQVVVPEGVSVSTNEFSSLCYTARRIPKQVSDLCGIYTSTLHNQKPLSEVLPRFVNWIRDCAQEAEQHGESYRPVLVAHNGFVFDFVILVAEVYRQEQMNIFNSINWQFADTLHDCKRPSKDGSTIFEGWTAQERRYFKLEKLYAKFFPGETYNAHRTMDDVRATVRLFTATTLQSVLSQLTICSKGEVVSSWKRMHEDWASSKEYTSRMGNCMPAMARRLKEARLTYSNLQSTL
ncbi:uncharacterized protein [Dysidea avara]|uniref:uncharacterized protein isoform X2 n=1 Tax=Dysidea avara TaxID=196820 RepID=UPI003327FCF3